MTDLEKEYYERRAMEKTVPVLKGLAELHGIKLKESMKKSEIVKLLINQIYDKVQDFVDLSKELNESDFVCYLNEIKKIYKKASKDISFADNSDKILLLLLKKDDLQSLDNLRFVCALKSEETRKEFVFSSISYGKIDEINNKTKEFVQKYNEENRWKICGEVLEENSDENWIKIVFYTEKGKYLCEQFEFRVGEEPYNPGPFERKRTYYYPLDTRNLEIRIENDRYLIIMDFDPNLVRIWFKKYLEFLFGEYSMEKIDKPHVEKTIKEVKRSLDNMPSIQKVENAIKDIKQDVNGCITKKNLSDDRKKIIKDIVNTIEYRGPYLKDEKTAAIHDFRCQAEYGKFQRIISPRTINDILQKIPQSTENFFLEIGDKKKTIVVEKDMWRSEVRLSKDEKMALRCFFER